MSKCNATVHNIISFVGDKSENGKPGIASKQHNAVESFAATHKLVGNTLEKLKGVLKEMDTNPTKNKLMAPNSISSVHSDVHRTAESPVGRATKVVSGADRVSIEDNRSTNGTLISQERNLTHGNGQHLDSKIGIQSALGATNSQQKQHSIVNVIGKTAGKSFPEQKQSLHQLERQKTQVFKGNPQEHYALPPQSSSHVTMKTHALGSQGNHVILSTSLNVTQSNRTDVRGHNNSLQETFHQLNYPEGSSSVCKLQCCCLRIVEV